jgi:hypothetical protein
MSGQSDLHEQLVTAGSRALVRDLRTWTMLDADDQRVGSPCHDADWVEPVLLSALCAECAQPHEVSRLGVVRGVRCLTVTSPSASCSPPSSTGCHR